MKQEIDYVVKRDCRNGMKILSKYINCRMKMLEDNPTVDKSKFISIEDTHSFSRYNEIDGREMLWDDVLAVEAVTPK